MTPRADELAVRLKELHDARWSMEAATRNGGRRRRPSLTRSEREKVLAKTGRRCHICGGEIEEKNWHADHVLAHTAGGAHDIENYLPAHRLCNQYRCNCLPEEVQWILKIGVWARTMMERRSLLGEQMCEAFTAYEVNRESRNTKTFVSAV